MADHPTSRPSFDASTGSDAPAPVAEIAGARERIARLKATRRRSAVSSPATTPAMHVSYAPELDLRGLDVRAQRHKVVELHGLRVGTRVVVRVADELPSYDVVGPLLDIATSRGLHLVFAGELDALRAWHTSMTPPHTGSGS